MRCRHGLPSMPRRGPSPAPHNFNGALDLKVTASDGALSASDTFTLTITPVNEAAVPSDFNGDHTSDILWRDDATGDTGFYQMVNGANAGWHGIGPSSTAYVVA